MKVIVATSKLQGQRKSDFCHATEGELVVFPFQCDGEKIDGPCGCRRSMSGIDSGKATTTMMVVEMEISSEEFRTKIWDVNVKAWGKIMSNEELKKMTTSDVNEL